MAIQYQVGDVVGLKSDGPDMTVKNLPKQGIRSGYVCQWFAGKKLEQGDFPEESLEPRKPKNDSHAA